LLQPPHVTIKWPFEVEDITIFERYCEELAKKINSFEVSIEGYGFFEPEVIFLKVIPSKELVNLHLKILYDLKTNFSIEKNQFEGQNQQFHTTLAYEDISQEMFSKAKEELENSEQPKISFKFNSIGLFKFTGEEWIIHKKFKINEEAIKNDR
jgi:2'-5' RNA ligase